MFLFVNENLFLSKIMDTVQATLLLVVPKNYTSHRMCTHNGVHCGPTLGVYLKYNAIYISTWRLASADIKLPESYAMVYSLIHT